MGKNLREAVVEEAKRCLLMNDLWETRSVRLENITVPTHIVASYSSTLHILGTFRGWRGIGSTEQ